MTDQRQADEYWGRLKELLPKQRPVLERMQELDKEGRARGLSDDEIGRWMAGEFEDELFTMFSRDVTFVPPPSEFEWTDPKPDD